MFQPAIGPSVTVVLIFLSMQYIMKAGINEKYDYSIVT